MTFLRRREWLALSSASLLNACGGGGGGGDGAPTTTTLSLSGPSSGLLNVASAAFTVAVSGPVAADIVVTLNSGGGGGSFGPATVTLTAGAPSATFTYTPTTSGNKTISITNNQGLANPASLTFAATDSSANPTFTNIANGKGATTATQQATASVTLSANRLALLTVVSVATHPNVPTVAGWTLVASHVTGDLNRVSVFRRMATSASTQSYLINFGGQATSFNRWSIDQSSANVNTSGTNGAGAVVQVKGGGQVGVVQNCLLTFDSSFASSANSTFAAFGASASSAMPTAGSGFAELSRAGVEPFGERALFVEYKPAADTTADMTWSAPYDVWTGIALEIAAG
jgi:hypothetical protein